MRKFARNETVSLKARPKGQDSKEKPKNQPSLTCSVWRKGSCAMYSPRTSWAHPEDCRSRSSIVRKQREPRWWRCQAVCIWCVQSRLRKHTRSRRHLQLRVRKGVSEMVWEMFTNRLKFRNATKWHQRHFEFGLIACRNRPKKYKVEDNEVHRKLLHRKSNDENSN